ncbi:MAG: hypothetical protein JRE23_04655 [Deltaproteobacteria bacterium]|nr:hypothetical protein [Deltaproteobacteria bacterium]
MIVLFEIYNQFLRLAGYKAFYIPLNIRDLLIVKTSVILPIAHHHGKQVLVKEEEFEEMSNKLRTVERVVSQVTGAPPYEGLSEEEMFDLAFCYIKNRNLADLMHEVEHVLWSSYVTPSSFSSS